MTGIVFENSLDHEIQLTIDGKTKAMLDPGETIAFDVREGQRVGYARLGSSTSALALPSPTARPKPTSAGSTIVATPSSRPKLGLRAASPIDQMNPDGSLNHRHPSMKAAAAAISIPWWEMAKHINNKPDQELKGFMWKRVGEQKAAPILTSVRQTRKGKAVKQLTKDGQPLRIWSSQTEAAESLGISCSGISKACLGTYPVAGGYRWEFVHP